LSSHARTAGLSSGHPSQRRRSPSATPPPSLVSLRLSSANSSLEQDLPFDSPCPASARKRPGDCLSLSRIAHGDPGRKGAPSGLSVASDPPPLSPGYPAARPHHARKAVAPPFHSRPPGGAVAF
jgi:hypothetical protein